MLEWMQKHRKYLVVTIWISTIAFVGAGFVGWGSYSYSSNANTIAKVGAYEIGLRDFQLTYSNTYNYYNQAFQGTLTREKAKQMGLEKIVLNNLVEQALLLNYAKDLGFVVLDEDVKKELANNKNFQKDGLFDIKQYKNVLANIGLKTKDYEENIKKDILISKLQKILNMPNNDKLTSLLSAARFMSDKLEVKSISIDPNSIQTNQEELSKFWEPIKNDFKTKKTYEIQYLFVDKKHESFTNEELEKFYEEQKFNFLDKEGKILSLQAAKDQVSEALKLAKSKKTALRQYLKVKKNELDLNQTITINEHDNAYPQDLLNLAKPQDLLKPHEQENGYIIIKLSKTNMPEAKTFEDAKDEVKKLYIQTKLKETLTQKAKEELDSFQGTQTQFLSLEDTNASILDLTDMQKQSFLSQVFTNKEAKGFVIFSNKAILYKIMAQKLLDDNKMKTSKNELEQMAQNLITNTIQTDLLTELKKRYKIEILRDIN